MDWKTNREAQDSTAEWAIRHLRGVPKEERLDVLRMLIVNHKLDVTPEELNRWCHRFEHPDIASGLAVKNVEGQVPQRKLNPWHHLRLRNNRCPPSSRNP